MDMRLKFPPVLVKPEENEQPTASKAGERPEVCQVCRQVVDFRNEYSVFSAIDKSGVLQFWHIFPCHAGPEEYDV